ncbi:MAG: undecaprenyl-diphosphate phosphatase [Bacteroidetes bacterium]|nr:undecaprenyl-diphosphate phosphatase [Bacteroidota bacterium]
MTTGEAIILAIVEGITEFLPVSSTGHLILTESAMRLHDSPFSRTYIVSVQFGAILSVLFLYRQRFLQSLEFYFKLLVAFIPAAILGLLLNDQIDKLLSSVTTVAVALIIGGVVLILVDKIFHRQIDEAVDDEDTTTVNVVDEFGIEYKKEVLKKLDISWLQAFIIGCFQCIAMIPGVSRSAATIVGGMSQKLNIKRAAEFSFFLAVPTISAAALYKLMKNFHVVTGENIDFLIIGNIVSFIVGMIAIKFFIGLITRYGLKFFGYYRIILGVVILILMAMGYNLEISE